jgi:hypothetical protein
MDKVEVDGNFYEVLGVDPDATPGVIRETYRRLMQQAGNHPDLGGDNRTAALMNKAYAVLKNPQQRHEYDLRLDVLRQVSIGLTVESSEKPLDPSTRCLFCEQRHDNACRDAPEVGCETCGSPLHAVENIRITTSDKRAVQRVGRQLDLTFFTDWRQPKGFAARTEDISPQGLRMVTRNAIHPGQRVRLVSNMVEAVGDVTYCVPRHVRWRTENVAGVAFLTLRFLRSVGGFVSRRV